MYNNHYDTREAWLLAATAILRETFVKEAHTALPDNIRVATSFPSRKATATKGRAIGQCWDMSRSKDKHWQIMISPVIDEPVAVLATLAHELVHVAAGIDAKHGKEFKKIALAVGLEGKMTATHASEDFANYVERWLEELGPYPHAALDVTAATSGKKKQTTRLLKAACEHCEFTVRVTKGAIEKVGGPPHCPLHGAMDVEGLEQEEEEQDDA